MYSLEFHSNVDTVKQSLYFSIGTREATQKIAVQILVKGMFARGGKRSCAES